MYNVFNIVSLLWKHNTFLFVYCTLLNNSYLGIYCLYYYRKKKNKTIKQTKQTKNTKKERKKLKKKKGTKPDLNPAPSASLNYHTLVIQGTELPPANSFSMIKPH